MIQQSLEDIIRSIAREEISRALLAESRLQQAERIAVSIAQASELVGYSESFLRIAIQRHDLIPSYANSKAVVEVDELRRWVRSLPSVPPRFRKRQVIPGGIAPTWLAQ